MNTLTSFLVLLSAVNGAACAETGCHSPKDKSNAAALEQDFYGTGPDKDAMARIKCPVYGFYGGDDARITAGVSQTTEQMKSPGKTCEPVTYEGAGHSFMRTGDDPGNTGRLQRKLTMQSGNAGLNF